MKRYGPYGSIARRFLFFSVLLLLLLSVGCDRREKDGATELLSGAFDAEVTVEGEGLSYRATVRRYTDSDGTKIEELTFLSPDSLKGIAATVRGDTAVLSRGELSVTLTGDGAERVLFPLSLLSGGNVIAHDGGREEDCDVLYCTLSDGRIMTVDARDGTLRAVRYGDTVVRISWIEKRRESGV